MIHELRLCSVILEHAALIILPYLCYMLIIIILQLIVLAFLYELINNVASFCCLSVTIFFIKLFVCISLNHHACHTLLI